ncbi:Protein kinase superfamily protein [Rhynchospora pubera]|uniref:Protein kinase superfamily protein n=1 Tax=Rhynchospora pubera TaxID=906938 RepID=A0AAV8H1C8_9POAL|nr:Protein kinase superfamily protein [Rhynchospora pubera]KAJ4810534.1 Protein kinase superfamily protein [Rhynchospora pubera]
MAEKSSAAQPNLDESSIEYILLGRNPDQSQEVSFSRNHINSWIDTGDLQLKHRIGRGQFGDVWIATRHLKGLGENRHHEVAVKMLHPLKDDQLFSFKARFDEVFSKCLGLTSVCNLRGISVQNGRVCIVMMFYEGSVGDKMARLKAGKLSLSDVLRYGAYLAQGVHDLHDRGILVLNLKPCNILLTESDHAILGDVGFPSLLINLSLPNPDMIQRLGSPNYMAPEQWQPSIRGPISYETDSWGFGCSILEMLSGTQPWRGRSPDEIFNSVVVRKERPSLPDGLPPEIENVLVGCFDYDLRNRPSMAHIIQAFKRCKDMGYGDSTWTGAEDLKSSNQPTYTDWSLLKDDLRIGDTVRSRKPKNSCRPECMFIPEGTIVGIEEEKDTDGHFFVMVRVHGFHDPLRAHSSTIERVTYGYAVGDWVRLRYESGSHVGILHGISREGSVTVGLIGMDRLYEGSYTDLQMSESYCVGQFIRVKASVSNPRFDWPRKKRCGGPYATGRISRIYPNGCLEVKFPGRFTLGENIAYLADPAEVELVNFEKCEGLVKKYQHLEDFHWAIRPLVVALGVFTALRVGIFVGGATVGRCSKKRAASYSPEEGTDQQPDGQNGPWLPPSMANILFTSPSR